MTREFSMVIEQDDDGFFVASVPALRGCYTQAKSLDVLLKRIREAIELCLEIEEPAISQFIGVQRIPVGPDIGSSTVTGHSSTQDYVVAFALSNQSGH
jgi:predicted RNase H-like HicB family nuclease